MQAAYHGGSVGLWEDFSLEQQAILLNDPTVKHVKVAKMTSKEMAGKNKAILKRRAKNKVARKSRRTR